MKQQLLFLGLWVVAPLAMRAQTVVPAPTAGSFFTADFRPCSPLDSGAYCAETTYRDSLSGVTRVYYPSGQLKQYVPYASVLHRVLHGTLTTWYEDGQMRTKEDYLNGIRNGDLLTYYPDGTLRRREQYVDGRCGVGRCYDPDGRAVPYFGYEQLPLYPGGEAELVKELTQAIRLNAQEAEAMRRESRRPFDVAQQGWKRQVDVQLAVALDGRITDAKVVHSTAGFLNSAALRAVAKLKRQFIPARRDGQLTTSYLTVPIYYTLEAPYRSQPSNTGLPPRRYGRF